MSDATVIVCTVDISWTRTRGRGEGGAWGPTTKWHVAREDDHGLARCSSRIILNVEDSLPITHFSLSRDDICKRCAP